MMVDPRFDPRQKAFALRVSDHAVYVPATYPAEAGESVDARTDRRGFLAAG